MKNILLRTLCVLLLAASCARAESYVGVNAGFFVKGRDPTVSTRFGYVLNQSGQISHILEAEVLWTRDKVSSVSLDVIPFMLNYRFSSEVARNFSVEVGGGVGFSYNRLRYSSSSYSDGAFAYQLLAGVAYKFDPTASFYAGVRHVDIGKATMAGITARIGSDRAIEAGLRFGF